MRIFAGPNGSGKSSVINYIRTQKANGHPIDFGYYINADDIAVALIKDDGFSFRKFELAISNKEFLDTAIASGLINKDFSLKQFKACYAFSDNSISLKLKAAKKIGIVNPEERIAQIIADFLRHKLLLEKKKFSFETVFSHPGKLDIMKQAIGAGYKVYLYFVSTASAEINKYRVEARKKKGGHDVPADKIESRYARSMDMLYGASQLAYQAFYFDNSLEGKEFTMFAHFKKTGTKKKWDKIDPQTIPDWFIKYYLNKQGNE
jgi:predicted ABC-type ATPase